VYYISGMSRALLMYPSAKEVWSLKYHRLHPEYIHQRIERLGHSYNLRILLLLCDVVSTNVVSFIDKHSLMRDRVNIKILYANLPRYVNWPSRLTPLIDLLKMCLINNITVMVAWTYVPFTVFCRPRLTEPPTVALMKQASTSLHSSNMSTDPRTSSKSVSTKTTIPSCVRL
jgi:hypothetical protein